MRRVFAVFLGVPVMVLAACENGASPVEAVIQTPASSTQGIRAAQEPASSAVRPSTSGTNASATSVRVGQDTQGITVRGSGPAVRSDNWGYGIVRGGSAQNLPSRGETQDAPTTESAQTAAAAQQTRAAAGRTDVYGATYAPVVVGGGSVEPDVGFGRRSNGVRAGAETDVLAQEGNVIPAGVGEGGMTGFGRDARGALTGQTSATDNGVQRGTTGTDVTRREGGIVGTGAGEGGTTGFGRRPNDATNPSNVRSSTSTRFTPATPATFPATGTAPTTTTPTTSGTAPTTNTTANGSPATGTRGAVPPSGSVAAGGTSGGAAGSGAATGGGTAARGR